MFTLLKGLGLGAGLMYFFDPEAGEQRRSVVGDRMKGLGHELEESLSASSSDLKSRAEGVVSDATRAMDLSVDLDAFNPANWSPAVRLAAGVVGVAVGLKMVRRMPLATLALGAVGLGLAVQNRSALASDSGILWPGGSWPATGGRSSSSEFGRGDFSAYGTTQGSPLSGGKVVGFDPATGPDSLH